MSRKFHIKNINCETLDKERNRTVLRLLDIVPKDYLFEVGSTAIDGVIGKQDLDFLVRTKSNDFQSIRTALDLPFTRNPRQLSNDEYQGYIVDSHLDIAVQLTIADSPYDNFLKFLTLLQSDEALRQKYNELKMKFDGALMSDYQDAKHKFIARALETSINS